MLDNKALDIKPLPEYRKPPVGEIAAGVHFELLSGWQTRHVGQFWSEVSREFPATQDQTPIFDVERGPRFEILTLPPLRRTFLLSADQTFVIQLQESRFLFNWRKTHAGAVYPRFDSFFKKFVGYWGQFSDFVTRERIGTVKPAKYELTYVNHIEQSGNTLATTVDRYVKMFNWKNLNAKILTPPTGINVVLTFPLPDQLGFGQANLSQGVLPDGRAVLMLVMSCSGSASPRLSLNDWFDAAHKWLSQGFVELTTDSAREDWGYKP